jgi:hypothetical protein
MRHICVADELGRYLKSARDSGDTNKVSVQTAFMECWGRLHGTYDNVGYSTHGMSKEQVEAMKARKVERPALTILAMTTPTTLTAALGTDDARNGFLNRFLIVSSPLERHMSRKTRRTRRCRPNSSSGSRNMPGRPCQTMMAFLMATDPTFVPEPIVRSRKLLREIEADLLAEMGRLDKVGLADLLGRTKKTIQRVSLNVALSDWADQVELKYIEWARDYVLLYTRQMIELIGENIDKSDVEQIADKIYDMIAKAGERGMTEREVSTNCLPFRRLSERIVGRCSIG